MFRSENKETLRKNARQILESLPETVREEAAQRIREKVLSLPVYRNAEVLLGFAPLPWEMPVWEILTAALSDKKAVALPKCLPGGKMSFYYIQSPDDLEPGFFGIREPQAGRPLYDKEERIPTLCLVPGLSFDNTGYRIGYGGGYYDRYFALCPAHITLAGITHSSLLTEKLPHTGLDVPVDLLITEREVLTFEPNAASPTE